MYGDDDSSLINWLQQIEYVTTENRNGEIVFSSNAPCQRHLTPLIQNTSNIKRSRRHSSALKLNISRCVSNINTSYATPRTWANSLIFRRNQLNKTTIEQQRTPQNKSSFFIPPKPNAPKKEPRSYYNQTKSSSVFSSEFFEHYVDRTSHSFSSFNSGLSNMNVTPLTEHFCDVEGQVRKDNYIMLINDLLTPF